MKTLFLIRHAKSSWKHPELDDHDRPLNKRGQRDLPRMAARIATRGWRAESMLTSTATRARVTAEALAEPLLGGDAPCPESALYTFDEEDLIALLREQPDHCAALALVGHNPAMTDLVNRLAEASLDNLPTCGIALLELAIDHWAAVDRDCAQLQALDYPKRP